jgi:hypothetical protein
VLYCAVFVNIVSVVLRGAVAFWTYLLSEVRMFVKMTSSRLCRGRAARAARVADFCGRLRTIHEEGQSLIESAFCLPILMMVAMGIFSFGLVFNNQQLPHTDECREHRRAATRH